MAYGSDVIYIVDSCGGMFPENIREYIDETFDKNPNIELGFHGHNNLGLGMANCLVSIKHGVRYIDTTLQGFGRSSGNVSTEHLICLLEKKGMIKDIDPLEIMNIGEEFIRPLISQTGLSSLDITLGWTQTHSGYMPLILSKSKKHKLDPRKLIKYFYDNGIENFNEKNLIKSINQIKNLDTFKIDSNNWPSYFGKEEEWKS